MTAWTPSAEVLAAEEAERKRYGGYTLEEADEVAMDPETCARLHGRIPDRVTKDPIPFAPSVLQTRMFWTYEQCQKADVPCRMVAVKIRRGGGSTGATWLMHLHAHNYQARLGAVGTDETVSMNMFGMMRFFNKWENFPWQDGKASKILETGTMAWPNGSSWEHYTAENPESARSAGLQGYHATEVGRWQDGGAKDAGETLKSMLGAVPRRAFTVAIEESTAQGAQGAFYRRWESARWPTAAELGCAEGAEYWRWWAEDSPQNIAESGAERALQFVRVFAAWFEDDENRPEKPIGAEDRERIERSLDAKELELIRRYRTIGPQWARLGRYAVTASIWDQLAWRRAVIATEFEGDVEAFEQENPSSPREAFASSGRHTFNRAGCAFMVEAAKSKVPDIGVLERQHDGGVVFRRTDINEAWVQVWQEPRDGYRYIAPLDTMGGASNSANADEADYNGGGVIRAAYVDEHGQKHAHALVCCLTPKNQFDPDVLADKMQLMSDWYGSCLVVFEVNNTGAAFRQEAVRLGMNLYRREKTDKATSETTEFIGWMTTKETRAQLIGTLKKHIRNNANSDHRGDGIEVWSKAVAEECQAMIVHPNGKDAAPGGKHDDHVLMLGMGLQCIEGATYYAARKRKRREPADRKNWKRVGRR